jgi:hypothetical protein
MSLLLDNLMDVLPVMGELTSLAAPHSLERDLLLTEMVTDAWRLVSSLGVVGVMQYYWGLAVAGCAGLFLIIYGVQLAEASRSTQRASNAKLKVLGVATAAWRGSAAVGCMVGGILIFVLALWSNQVSVPGFGCPPHDQGVSIAKSCSLSPKWKRKDF